MESLFPVSPGTVVIAAFATQAVGFMVRDELWLRGLILVGTLFYILYYCMVPAGPLWDAIIGSGILGAINVVLIVIILRERTLMSMSDEESSIYNAFAPLTPGQFRRIMKKAERIEASEDTILTREGAKLDDLYFVLEGPLMLNKGDQEAALPEHCFIGEIAFLLDRDATATVTVAAKARYLKWSVADLRGLMHKSPALNNALLARFNAELASKLARSTPDRGM